jgi:nucleotide-binding universal stress UspA family protein
VTRHILVPLDGSTAGEAALREAAELAQALGARVTLAAVVPRPGWAHVPHISELDEVHRRLATEYLDERAAQVRSQGVTTVDTVVLFGEVAEALAVLSNAEIGDVDLVVMSTHGIVDGAPSHARDVLMASPAPVLMMRAPAV